MIKEVVVRHLHLCALVVGAGLIVASGARVSADVSLKAGDPAPDFSLQGSDGKMWKLSELHGKTVVLAWFPKAFTSGCTMECKSLKQSGDAIRAFDVKYFAVSVDEAEQNKKFAESLELDFPVLSDPGKGTATSYGVLNPNGLAKRWTFYIGPDGKISYVDTEINTATAAADIVTRLAALGVAKK
jgi:peroxiredoxin Q/BCP